MSKYIDIKYIQNSQCARMGTKVYWEYYKGKNLR